MINELENWYISNCDENWEHQYGIIIDTLDNPGWRIQIDLEGTRLEKTTFETIENIEHEREWIVCKVENKKFTGFGGPKELKTILEIFINWAKQNDAI